MLLFPTSVHFQLCNNKGLCICCKRLYIQVLVFLLQGTEHSVCKRAASSQRRSPTNHHGWLVLLQRLQTEEKGTIQCLPSESPPHLFMSIWEDLKSYQYSPSLLLSLFIWASPATWSEIFYAGETCSAVIKLQNEKTKMYCWLLILLWFFFLVLNMRHGWMKLFTCK